MPGVAQRVGRGIALLFHDRGTRRGWVVSSTPWPHFIPGKDPVPILQEAGWDITLKYYDTSTTELIHTSEVPWHWCVYSKSNRPYLHSPVPPFCRSSRNWSYAALRSPVTDADANSATSWTVHEDSLTQTINCQSVWSTDLISLGQITLSMQHFELRNLWGEYHGAIQL